MKLKTLFLENFRGYKEKIEISFSDLTTFVGKNDVGKSTILEALAIFFNNELVKIDSKDANIHGDNNVTITCDFCELPDQLVLDSGEKTTLAREYLTISDDVLRIKKVYDCGKSKISPVVYIVAKHPSAEGVDNLLSLKEKELKEIVKRMGIESPLKGNPLMREAIWNSCGDLRIQEREIEVSKAKEDGKDIWGKIDAYLPMYALFQSDRSSSDSDGEVQDPMREAIKEAIGEVQDKILEIQKNVEEKAKRIAEQTQEALIEINPRLAESLIPRFSSPPQAKWNSLFSIAMDTNEGIALNKRGSGIRRIVLVGFFKAAAERRAEASRKKDIIYAIEEPETSQHPDNQKILVTAFKELSSSSGCQVILTTHSPGLAQELPIESLRFIHKDSAGVVKIGSGSNIMQEVVDTLGVFPDMEKRVEVILCVEGPTDVVAFKSLSRCLREKCQNIIDIGKDPRILIIPLGGSTLKHWVEGQYLRRLNVPEVHIYDRDVKDYEESVENVNARNDDSWGVRMSKREIENYLHPDAIMKCYGVEVNFGDEEDVPRLFAEAYFEKNKERMNAQPKSNKAKGKLSDVFEKHMTYEYLKQRDPNGEVQGWFERISRMLSVPSDG